MNKPLLAALLVLAFVGHQYAADSPSKYHTLRELPVDTKNLKLVVIRAKLDQIIFPHVEFKAATAAEAINWAKQTSKSVSPDGMAISFVIKCSASAPDISQIQISLDIRDASLPQVLDAICRQIDYVWGVDTYAIVLLPREEALKRTK